MPATVGAASGAEGAFRVSTEVWVIEYRGGAARAR